MNFNHLVEKCLDNITALRKVRIKVDPKSIIHHDDLVNKESYEGYILEEGLSSVKILVLPPDIHVTEIPTELIEYIADENKDDVFDSFKHFIVNQLNLKSGDPTIDKITACTEINEIEALMRQTGLDDENLAELYKEFILS